MPAPAPLFWSPEFEIETRADGSILMSQKGALSKAPRALPDCLVHWAKEAPQRPFLAERDGAHGWRTLTYADVLQEVRKLGAGLLALGLGPERPLIILSENSLDHALLGLAAQYVGVPYAPLSTAYSLVSSDHSKLKAIAALLSPGAVYAADGATYEKALGAISGGDHRELASHRPGNGALTLAHLRTMGRAEDADAAYQALTGETVAKYLFTSGSTGAPKAVINTQSMLTTNQAMVADCFRFLQTTPPVVVEWAPWNHTAGGNKVFNMVLYNGGTFHIDDGRPSPEGIKRTIANIKDVRPTWYFNVPVGYDMLIRAFDADPDLREAFFGRLQMMMYAGAGLAQHSWDDLLRLSRETTGHQVLLTTGLGATETGPFALMCTEQQTFAGNIGLPARGITLKLVPNSGKLEARLKGPAITPGYFGDAANTRDAFDEEGFYRLGDALRPADPDDLTKGFFFDGRTAENFKLETGTWAAVGAMRAATVDAFGGLLRDVVMVGENRPYLGALGIANEAALRACVGENGGAGDDLNIDDLLAHPAVQAALQRHLNDFAQKATGSSNRVKRLLILTSPPDLDKGEVTDKGSLNQRAMRENRAAQVAQLYEGSSGVLIAG